MEDNPYKNEPFLNGFHNQAVRYWYYLENGLSIVNEFRNLILAVIGIYIALKLENPVWLILMFVPSVLILTVVGYYVVHHMAKIKEWVAMRFSTHFAIRNFDYTKGTYEKLEEILAIMKKRGVDS